MTKIKCPKCNSINVVEIIYGMPTETNKFSDKDIECGGCCIEPTSSTHKCKSCDYDWQDSESGPRTFFD
ncbi:MAG: hypothetical protein OXC46_01120 [Thaumarchaeota archaeon]|nr:hypothetical protein [Nitrososphaerota archaeon]